MIPNPTTRLITAFALVLVSCSLMADEFIVENSGWSITDWTLMTSGYTWHFDPEPYHENHQNLFAVEAGFSNRWILGASSFDNSYGQNSQFLYLGRKWQVRQSNHWYVKLRGGLLHGYKEPYEDKIPLNGLGVAPAIIPALGFQYRNFVSEINFAGTAAVTFTFGFQF